MRAWLFTVILFISLNSNAITLQEAIHTAFQKNPITHANSLRVEAAKDRAEGARLDMLPSGYISYSKGLNRYDSTSDGVRSRGENQNSGWSIGATANLYNGGASIYRARAAEKRAQVLEAINNSTKPFMEDTHGYLANDVYLAYFNLVSLRRQHEFYSKQAESLKILLGAAKTEEQKTEVQNAIISSNNGLLNLKNSLEKWASSFQYFVKVPVPARLSSMDELIEGLVIPVNSELAVQTSFSKAPDIMAAQYSLEEAKYNRKAAIADMFAPKVDLSVSRGQQNLEGMGINAESLGTSVNLTISVPLGLSRAAYTRAINKEVAAAEKDLDKYYEKTEYNLKSVHYPDFYNLSEMQERLKFTYAKATEDLEALLAKVQSKQDIDIRYALSLFSNQQSQFIELIQNEANLAGTKFEIQKVIGTLFDSVETAILK